MSTWKVITGDCIDGMATLPAGSVRCCVTSPPYWGLRDYGVDGQIGLEKTPDEYVAEMVAVFREVRRVLADDGTLWLNLGDSYAANTNGGKAPQGGASARPKIDDTEYASRRIPDGLKPKDLLGIPWRVAFALQADGWYLRQDIIWHKPNPMPESVTDRCTKAHEYIFLLAKQPRYYYDAEAVSEPVTRGDAGSRFDRGKTAGHLAERMKIGDRVDDGMRNRRSVWTVTPEPFPEAHFATYPPKLIEPCILAGSAPGDTILDPFTGSGTTGVVAAKWGRKFIGCELNPEYVKMAERRISEAANHLFAGGAGWPAC